jgi:hypothetical protein
MLAKGVHENAVDAQDRQKKEGDDSQQQWHYPKPWKFCLEWATMIMMKQLWGKQIFRPIHPMPSIMETKR